MSKLRSFLRGEPRRECMEKKVLIIMVGVPRSGKSTFAAYTGAPIVSRDGIRKAMGCYPFVKDAEDAVTMMETYMVRSLFAAGHRSVVVDAFMLESLSAHAGSPRSGRGCSL